MAEPDPGTVFRTLDVGDWVEALAWSPDGTRIAAGGGTTVAVFPVTGGDPLVRLTVVRSASVAFSPDGAALGVSDAEQVRVHRAADGSTLWTATVRAGEDVNVVAFTPDSALVLAATNNAVGVFAAAGGAARQTVTVEEPQIAGIDISRDGTRLLLAVDHNHGGSHRDAGSARVVEIASGKELGRLVPADDTDAAVHAAVFTADGRFALCSRTDSTCRLFDAAAGAEQWKVDHFGEDLAVDPTGQWLALGTAESTALVLDQDGAQKAETSHDGAVTFVAFAPNGRWMASAGADNVLHVHNVQTNADRYQHDDLGEVRGMAFSPDSRWLALAIDSSVVILDNGPGGAQP
jgi:WD40 repeat protein